MECSTSKSAFSNPRATYLHLGKAAQQLLSSCFVRRVVLSLAISCLPTRGQLDRNAAQLNQSLANIDASRLFGATTSDASCRNLVLCRVVQRLMLYSMLQWE